MNVSRMLDRLRGRAPFWIAGLVLLCFVYFMPRPGDWNGDARLDLILSLGNRGTVWIDGYQWNAGVDTAYYRGHYYATKAPGQSLAGVPIYLAYRAALSSTGHGDIAGQVGKARTWKKTYASYYLLQAVETIYTVAIPSMLLLLLFFWFLGYFSTSLLDRALLTLALGLGTSIFAYSQVLYPHVPSAAFQFLGFVLVFMAAHPNARRGAEAPRLPSHPGVAVSLAGLSLGCGVLFDHTAAIGAAVVGLYALLSLPLRNIVFLAAGAAPPLLGLLTFDTIAYHNPLVTGYSTQSILAKGSNLAATTGQIGPSAILGLTFSPYRGLFFISPFLLLAVPGLVMWARRGGKEWLVCSLAPFGLFLAVTTVAYWYGGAAVGPRYLVPIIPFLALPIVFVLNWARSLPARLGIYGLMAVSVAVTWIETVGGKGYPPVGIYNPLLSVSLPALEHGNLPLSAGTVLVYPFAGMNTPWTLFPLLLLLIGWTMFCCRRDRRGERRRAAAPVKAGV